MNRRPALFSLRSAPGLLAAACLLAFSARAAHAQADPLERLTGL